MTFEDLRAFVAAFEAKSLSEAAREAGCTQGAIAQHVRRLERELGVELFTRDRRGVTPTEEGRVLYEGARGGLSTIEQAVEAVGQTRQARARSLRLAASASGASGPYLRPAILEAKQRDPSLVVEIEHKNTAQERLDAVRRGRSDLTIVPSTDVIRGLEVRPCFEVALGLLVHREHRFARREQLELVELGDIRYIAEGRSSGTYRHVAAALSAVGITLEVSHVSADQRTSRLMVELGRGETFAPLMLREEVESGGEIKLVPVPSLRPIQMAFAARSFALLPEAAREFLAIYEGFARKLGRSPRRTKPSANSGRNSAGVTRRKRGTGVPDASAATE